MSSPGLDDSRRVAEHAGVPFVTLEPVAGAEECYRQVDPAARELLTGELCQRLGVLPIGVEDETVVLAAAQPMEYLPYDVAAELQGRPVRCVVAPADQLSRALNSGGQS